MIYHLSPSIQRTIWGGKNLEHIKNIEHVSGVDPIGETWEISILEKGPSICDGKKLELAPNEELTYMVKLIDTGDVLSIQVHPDDEYARIHENSSGKLESYVILHAETDAVIYLGLKSGVTKESFLLALKNKENISHLMNAYKVVPGDFFYVPPGSLHAIGAGITMAEVQQSSGITYRVWDWDRMDSQGKPRELHIEKSLAVINFDPKANTAEHFRVTHGLFKKAGLTKLISHSSFESSIVNLSQGESIEINLSPKKRLPSILNLFGKIEINGEVLKAYSSALFRNEKTLSIKALQNTSFLLME